MRETFSCRPKAAFVSGGRCNPQGGGGEPVTPGKAVARHRGDGANRRKAMHRPAGFVEARSARSKDGGGAVWREGRYQLPDLRPDSA